MRTTTRLLLALAMVTAVSAASAQNHPGRQSGDLRMPDAVRVGDTAPDFKLKTKDGSREVQLSGFRGKRPVVLVFGSFT